MLTLWYVFFWSWLVKGGILFLIWVLTCINTMDVVYFYSFLIFIFYLFISGWTSSAANSYCSEYISSSAAAKECKFLVQPSRYSDSCQSDVLYSGNSRLASLHLKNLKEDCRQVIQTDQSLALTSKHKEDILKTLCLSSCSGHGTCQDGIIFSFD